MGFLIEEDERRKDFDDDRSSNDFLTIGTNKTSGIKK
jgi:hypothetical protein